MKEWYYSKFMNVFGPFTKDEIISRMKNNELNKDNRFWCSGLKSWSYLTMDDIESIDSNNHIETIMPDVIVVEDYKEDNQDIKIKDYDTANVFIKISSILLGLIGIFNIWLFFIYLSQYDLGIGNGLNLIFGIAFLFIAYGVYKLNKTAYNWAIGSSVLNIIIYIVEFLDTGQTTFFLLFCVFILFSLIKNKSLFK